jgi:hypothetical protein
LQFRLVPELPHCIAILLELPISAMEQMRPLNRFGTRRNCNDFTCV